MNTQVIIKLTVSELCECAPISEDVLKEIVREGILEPSGDSREDWVFDLHMLDVVRKAARLKRELELEWAGIALAMDLLDELDQLRADNEQLRQRLDRFLKT